MGSQAKQPAQDRGRVSPKTNEFVKLGLPYGDHEVAKNMQMLADDQAEKGKRIRIERLTVGNAAQIDREPASEEKSICKNESQHFEKPGNSIADTIQTHSAAKRALCNIGDGFDVLLRG